MNLIKTKLSALFVLLVIMLIGFGCATQGSIESDLNDSQQQAYQDWQQQRQQSAQADSTASSLNVHDRHNDEKQPVISGQLKMEDAVNLALLYNRDLEASIEQQEFAKGKILQSYSAVTPSVSVDASYRRPEKVNSFNINGNRIQVGFLNNYSAKLSIKQPLFAGGSIGAGLKAAKFYKALTHKNIQTAAENTIYQTSQMYLNVLLLKQQYEVSKNQVALSDSMLKDVNTKKEFGTASDFNVLRAKVQLSNDRAKMLSNKNDLEQTKAQLYKVMGVSQNSKVQLKDSLSYTPQPVNESQAVQQALVSRPDLDAQLLNVKLQAQSVHSAKSDYFPTISAFFNDTFAKPNPFVTTENSFGHIYNLGIQLNWSIFDLSREGQIMQEKSTLRQQKLSYITQREQVLYDVHIAILGMENAAESIEAQKLTLEQAQEGLRLANVGYRQGTQDQVAILDARQSFAEAQLNYFRSMRDYEMARLQLLKAEGQLRFKVNEKPEDLDSVKFNPDN